MKLQRSRIGWIFVVLGALCQPSRKGNLFNLTVTLKKNECAHTAHSLRIAVAAVVVVITVIGMAVAFVFLFVFWLLSKEKIAGCQPIPRV
jgi:uncharacterized protein (DUF983 family)